MYFKNVYLLRINTQNNVANRLTLLRVTRTVSSLFNDKK